MNAQFDFGGTETQRINAEATSVAPNTAIPERSVRWVPHNCECGSKGGQYLGHYDLMRCNCGRMHWALQPQRGGPLLLYPWPGLPIKI